MKSVPILILLGSKNDLQRIEPLLDLLNRFGVDYSLQVASAHRTPERLDEIITEYEKQGVKLFIACAGLAAHLPGVVASKTTLPVIGIPISVALKGVDSLLSILQMPPGIPVATVGVDAALNGGILALQILAQTDAKLRKKLVAYRQELKKKSLKDAKETSRILRLRGKKR